MVLATALVLIMSKATRIFNQVFEKYDDLNASVQENVTAIRVVKAFVREDYENNKFKAAAENLYRLFVKAESRLALNNPIMMLIVYGCMIAISWFGAHFIVAGDLTTGQLTSLFSYVLSVLMSLMMLSMVFVMLTMSLASARRIAQVLHEQPDFSRPASGLSPRWRTAPSTLTTSASPTSTAPATRCSKTWTCTSAAGRPSASSAAQAAASPPSPTSSAGCTMWTPAL